MGDVLLVAMPFADPGSPSLALGLFKARLAELGVRADVAYLNLPFAERIGWDPYIVLMIENGERAGDWAFSHSLFGHGSELSDEYLGILRELGIGDRNLDAYRSARDQATPFVEECLEGIDWGRYGVVGFTTSFQQNTAALALARRVKERSPGTRIVFGGANCEAEMGRELLRSFPFVDFVCLGEGDDAFPELVRALEDGEGDGGVPAGVPAGMIGRLGERIVEGPARVRKTDLDGLPDPDFDDYFDALERSSLRGEIHPEMPLETSRGCWWGEKQHCTFCGLNGLNMGFRSKSPPRALAEIRSVVERYGPRIDGKRQINFADNIIDPDYFETLLPQLQQSGFEFFYETKVNVRKSQLALMAECGVTAIQPGLESLSTPVLKLMKKGCNLLQNVQLLKWSEQLGIRVDWNVLYGFPDEDPAEYSSASELIPSIRHLTAPGNVGRIVLERFSPYFREPEEHGLCNVRPSAAYRYIYPFPDEVLARLVYQFDFDYADGRNPEEYTAETREALDGWRDESNRDFLLATDVDGTLVLWDGRETGSGRPTWMLEGLERTIYLECDRIRGLRAIEQLGAGAGAAPETARAILDDLLDRKLMLREGNQFLSLAVQLADVAAGGNGHPPAPKGAPGRSTSELEDLRSTPRLAPAPHLRTAELGGRRLMLDVEERRLHVLNEVAGIIWDLCADGVETRRVVELIAEAAPGDTEVVRSSTWGTIRDLVDRSLLEPRRSF